jgi:hypothetical protein
MAEQPPAAIVGCLLDVSGSMREPLGSGHLENDSSDRLSAVINSALKLAKTEQQHDGNAYMFVGVFGLSENVGNPPVVDLCSIIGALELDDARDGHQALIGLADSNDLEHVTKYIRTKLTATEARIVYAYLQRHPERTKDFIRLITGNETDTTSKGPPEQNHNGVNFATSGMGQPALDHLILSSLARAFIPQNIQAGYDYCTETAQAGYDYCKDTVEDYAVEYSSALRLARKICRDWMSDFTELTPLRIGQVICLLERLQEVTRDRSSGNNLGNTIRGYMYGSTPMTKALDVCLVTFRKYPNVTQKVLLVISDGESTDGNPVPKARQLKSSNVVLATVYLTSDNRLPNRRLFDRACNDWEEGQRTLFDMASRVSASTHPVPVLNTVGWAIPSSGECALYATVSSRAVLNELCALLFRARFGSTDVLFDIVGRVRLDTYVNDNHVRTCDKPSNQGQSMTCYAHAIAAIVHMSLLRIEGREGGHPTIPDIRRRILADFPPVNGGQVSEMVLQQATKWYRPLRFKEVDEDGARQAVLRRRPVLATFRLSESGWETFSQHFKSIDSQLIPLKREHMECYHAEAPCGGHAVVLTGCDPNSLTFLNSWGGQWGNRGSFSIENASVLGLDGHPVRFYDVYWLLGDLLDTERQAYADANAEAFKTRASQYPSLLEIEAQCPECSAESRIAGFTGDIRRAICPKCHAGFEPEPGHLLQALYARHGLGGERVPGDQ